MLTAHTWSGHTARHLHHRFVGRGSFSGVVAPDDEDITCHKSKLIDHDERLFSALQREALTGRRTPSRMKWPSSALLTGPHGRMCRMCRTWGAVKRYGKEHDQK